MIRVQKAAGLRIDDIYRYTRNRWGVAQADDYIKGLFAHFDKIAQGTALSKPVPADFGVTGYYTRYGRHVIYWRDLPGGDIGIVTVLHDRMHQMDRFRGDVG